LFHITQFGVCCCSLCPKPGLVWLSPRLLCALLSGPYGAFVQILYHLSPDRLENHGRPFSCAALFCILYFYRPTPTQLLTQFKPHAQVVEVVLPTYIQKPSEDTKFYPSKVKKVAQEVLDDELVKVDEDMIDDWIDEGDAMEEYCKVVADRIKSECRTKCSIERYKLIVQVTIGQQKDQGARITSRCLWDTTTDNYASVEARNTHVWINAMVFGLYAE